MKIKDRFRSQRANHQFYFMLRSRVSRDMSGKVTCFQHITVRPEPVEGQTVGLGNSPSIFNKGLDFELCLDNWLI